MLTSNYESIPITKWYKINDKKIRSPKYFYYNHITDKADFLDERPNYLDQNIIK